MKPRSIALLVPAILFSQLANSQSSSPIVEREAVLPACTFSGNSDFYGIGVRLGFYFQWFSGLLAFIINPEDSEAQADAQTIFLLSNLIALFILQLQDAKDINVVVPIMLFYMFFGGTVSAVTSATTSLISWRSASRTQKIGIATRQVFVQLTFLATFGYSFYFWTKGFQKFKRFPDECGGTYVFPLTHRISFKDPTAGAGVALTVLVALYLLIWLVAYMRLKRTFPSHVLVASSDAAFSQPAQRTVSPRWNGRQLKWNLIGAILISIVIIWSIAGIELTLIFNHVTDVNSLGSTGQLIPFVIGIASLPSALWGAFEHWMEVKKEDSHELQDNKIESQELLRSSRVEQQGFSKLY